MSFRKFAGFRSAVQTSRDTSLAPGTPAARVHKTQPAQLLQRSVGNRALQRALQPGGAQPTGARAPLTLRSTQKPSGSPGPSFRHTIAASGRPLPLHLAREMGAAFNFDFSRVRIHDNKRAADSAREVDARAYTAGNHVVFGAGEFDPYSPVGRTLLMHELVHVMQQRGKLPSRPTIAAPDSLQEREADTMSRSAAVHGLAIGFPAQSGGMVMRKTTGTGYGPAHVPSTPSFPLSEASEWVLNRLGTVASMLVPSDRTKEGLTDMYSIMRFMDENLRQWEAFEYIDFITTNGRQRLVVVMAACVEKLREVVAKNGPAHTYRQGELLDVYFAYSLVTDQWFEDEKELRRKQKAPGDYPVPRNPVV